MASSSSAGGAGGQNAGLPWTKHFGSNKLDYSCGVAVNSADEVTIHGRFSAPIDFGGGALVPSGTSTNVALARLDANGNHIWSKIFPHTTDASEAIGVLDDGLGNLLLFGALDGTFKGQDFGGPTLTECGGYNTYVAKLDSSGNHIWSKGYGLCGHLPQSAAVDTAHNLLLTGWLGGAVDFGTGTLVSNGGYDVMLAKIDPGGNGVWAKSFGGVGDQVGFGVAVDLAGNTVLVGVSDNGGGVDFGGGLVPLVSSAGGWVAKLGSDATYLWSRAINNLKPNQAGVFPAAVATDSKGGVIVAGQCFDDCDFGGGTVISAAPGNVDIFLAKYDATGNVLWAKHFGSGVAGPNSLTNAVTIGSDDDIYLAGYFDGMIDLGGSPLQGTPEGAFVARFDTAGNHLWSQTVQATGEAGNTFRLDANQNGVLFGSFFGTLTFGGDFGNQQYVVNDWDLYVARFKPGP